MNKEKNRCGILYGKEAVRTFLKNPSDYMLKKYLAAGMPVRIESGNWLAHQDNLDDFFKHYTRKKSRVNDELQ